MSDKNSESLTLYNFGGEHFVKEWFAVKQQKRIYDLEQKLQAAEEENKILREAVEWHRRYCEINKLIDYEPYRVTVEALEKVRKE